MDAGRPFRHKKSLGQNFLVDKNILRKIVERAAPSPQDIILEIGPGQGALTRSLLESKCSHLYSIEIDPALAPFLSEFKKNYPQKFSLLWGDALQFVYSSLDPEPNKIVANIPYNITTPLIWRFLETLNQADYLLLMVQKEAADRITAPPRTKERYPLGVTLELMGRAEKVLNVSRGAFRPIPDVKSCLIEIRLNGGLRGLAGDQFWRDLLRVGFSQRRKKLLNNLKTSKHERPWEEHFSDLGLNKNSRAEELTAAEWFALYKRAKTEQAPSLS